MEGMYRTMPPWTPEKLLAWATERASGHQYDTGHGPVMCPPRNWEGWEEPKMKLKLEAGKYYVTAEGKVHGPLYVSKKYPDRFTDEQGSWYGDDGHYWQQRPDCPFRLVREAPFRLVKNVSDAEDLGPLGEPGLAAG